MSNQPIGLSILGSTGSVGESTLDVIRENQRNYRVVGLSCFQKLDRLVQQIQEFQPEVVAVGEGRKLELKQRLIDYPKKITILEGQEGYVQVGLHPEAQKIVAAIVGSTGLIPVYRALQQGKTVALANKEPVVLAGELMSRAALRSNAKILPLDSEHNAIFQSLQGGCIEDVDHITLTASGGPFRTFSKEKFTEITRDDALKHPNWSMGSKITIDSATMMNKCLEIIEARWLFQLPPEKIRVFVHPQSVIHSLVTYNDGSTLAQLGVPDMKVPIAHCIGYPKRIPSGAGFLDFKRHNILTFEPVNHENFPTVSLAYRVLKLGNGVPAALNGANEAVVTLFLQKKITFLDIFEWLQKLVRQLEESASNDSSQTELLPLRPIATIQEALSADQWGRDFIQQQYKIR